MASPTTVAPTVTSFSTGATAHNVNMPASGIVAGMLLAMGFCSTSNTATLTTPTGWILKVGPTVNFLTAVIYIKLADGSENGTTVNVVSSASTTANAQVYPVQGWGGNTTNDVVAGTPATGSSTGPDPPSSSWVWGSLDNLVIVWSNYDSGTNPTVAPTNYANLVSTNIAGVSGIASARRSMTAAASPEDPGAFTQATSNWVANTLVIKQALVVPSGIHVISQAQQRVATR